MCRLGILPHFRHEPQHRHAELLAALPEVLLPTGVRRIQHRARHQAVAPAAEFPGHLAIRLVRVPIEQAVQRTDQRLRASNKTHD